MITPVIIKFDKGRVKCFHEKLGYHFVQVGPSFIDFIHFYGLGCK